MMSAPPSRLEALLGRLHDEAPYEEVFNDLIALAYDRLRARAGKMLSASFPRLGDIHSTHTILHEGVIKFAGALRACRPENAEKFFGLAALQMRRVLLDLAREARGGNVRLVPLDHASGEENIELELGSGTHDPLQLVQWTEFHQAVGSLPEPQRAAFELCFYGGLSQATVAELLGISQQTVSDRFRAAGKNLERFGTLFRGA
jgi:RNA polymerase sigma factor (sigma-70 family)